jgi:hypothetical protein
MRQLIILLLISSSLASFAQTPEITITTKNQSEREKTEAALVQQLLKKYDLSTWIFTDKVIIEAFAIPHSHPVLTLNTKPKTEDERLSTFLHEQIHWFADEKSANTEAAIAELKKVYKDVPHGNREGARDEYSTYLHLIVCYLEYQSMVKLVGPESARVVMRETNHYTWIYKTVLKDTQRIGEIVRKNQLSLTD